MREQVILRDRHCVFPWCGRDARRLRPRPHRPLRPTRRGRTTRPDQSPEPRTPVPATSPGQDLHRLDLPTRPRRHLHLDQPPRAHLDRRTRRHRAHDRARPPGPSRGDHARHLTPRSVPGGAHPSPVNQPNPQSDGHFLRLTGIALPVNRGFPRPTGETNHRPPSSPEPTLPAPAEKGSRRCILHASSSTKRQWTPACRRGARRCRRPDRPIPSRTATPESCHPVGCRSVRATIATASDRARPIPRRRCAAGSSSAGSRLGWSARTLANSSRSLRVSLDSQKQASRTRWRRIRPAAITEIWNRGTRARGAGWSSSATRNARSGKALLLGVAPTGVD